MRYALPLVPLAVCVASCDSTKPANPINEREAVALLREFVSLVDDAGGEGASTENCSVRGTATVIATHDGGVTGDSIWNRWQWTIVPADCEADVVNDTLTLNGRPDVRLTGDQWIVHDDDFDVVKAEAEWLVRGAMTWRRRNGDSDACSFDLAFASTEFRDRQFVGKFRGRVCGLDLVVDPSELTI